VRREQPTIQGAAAAPLLLTPLVVEGVRAIEWREAAAEAGAGWDWHVGF